MFSIKTKISWNPQDKTAAKDIEHIYCGRPEIIYKQSIINKGIRFINSKNTEKIMIGDLKVKLKELES